MDKLFELLESPEAGVVEEVKSLIDEQVLRYHVIWMYPFGNFALCLRRASSLMRLIWIIL